MAWSVEFSPGARRQIKKLDGTTRREIIAHLETRVATASDPKQFGHALKHDLSGLWRYRVGDWRIVCSLQEERLVVLVLKVAHRSQVCD